MKVDNIIMFYFAGDVSIMLRSREMSLGPSTMLCVNPLGVYGSLG